jgi:preprotein translocase subunit SecG
MYTAVTILIILTCILLVLVVLVQNPKGGGISTGIIGSNQVMGVKKTTDFIEKLTWGLALTLVVLCLAAGLALPGKQDRAVGSSMQDKIENAPAPVNVPAQQPQGQQPAQQQQNQAPAQQGTSPQPTPQQK